jgi:hypothetical protein
MEALALIAVAATFSYFATIVVRRHEVLRSIALDIDKEVQTALRLSGTFADEPTDLLNEIHASLIRARLQATSLPRRQREPVDGQIRLAQDVTSQMITAIEDSKPLYEHPELEGNLGTVAGSLMSLIVAARQVLAPLLLPPPLLGYRRPGKPRSFPDPKQAREIMSQDRPVLSRVLDAFALARGDDNTLG